MRLSHMRKLFASLLAAVVFAFGIAPAEEASPNAQKAFDAFIDASGGSGGNLNSASFTDAQRRLENSASSEVYATSMLTSLAVQRVFRNAIPSVSDYSQTAHRQNENSSLGVCTGSICAPEHKWVTWDTPFLQWDTQKRNDGYLGYDLSASGFATENSAESRFSFSHVYKN